jgi:hypothetical protein
MTVGRTAPIRRAASTCDGPFCLRYQVLFNYEDHQRSEDIAEYFEGIESC